MATNKRVFTLRLTDEVFEKIGFLATKEHRSMTNYIENNGGAFQALSPGWKRRAGNLKHSGSPARFCMYWGEKLAYKRASTSSCSGMDLIAPFLVVTRYAAALAKLSISLRFSSVSPSRPWVST